MLHITASKYSACYEQYDCAHTSYHGIAGDLVDAANGLRRRTSDQDTFPHGFQYETPSCHARMPANSDIPWRQPPAHSLHSQTSDKHALYCVLQVHIRRPTSCACACQHSKVTWGHRSIQDCTLDEMRLSVKAIFMEVVCPEDVQTACHVVYGTWQNTHLMQACLHHNVNQAIAFASLQPLPCVWTIASHGLRRTQYS